MKEEDVSYQFDLSQLYKTTAWIKIYKYFFNRLVFVYNDHVLRHAGVTHFQSK